MKGDIISNSVYEKDTRNYNMNNCVAGETAHAIPPMMYTFSFELNI